MTRALAPFCDLLDSAVDFYRRSATCRAICQGVGLFFAVLLVDGMAGFPTGTRMAYILPIWFATTRGGRHAGATLVALTTIALAIVDSAQQGRTNSFLINFVLQTAVVYALMRIFDSVENKMRRVTTLAMRDSLTGLYNRLEIEGRARKAIDRAIVLNQPLALAMVDCDRFKELNDKYGHSFGDEVLRLLGKTMRRSMSEAIIGRTGGDEFILVLPNRDRFQALSALEAMLDRFMSHTEIVGRSAGFSYGVAVVGDDGIEYEQLLRAADDDMYRVKAGRSELAATLAS